MRRSPCLRTLFACLGVAVLACLSCGPTVAQQPGNAFLVFDISTGRLSMNPGSGQLTSYGIEAAAGMSFNGTAAFPSGASFFPPTNTSTLIGDAFYNLTAPDIVPNASFISGANLQLGSSSGRVIASTIPGWVGTPEWNFGTVGPTNLTLETALTGLGATAQGGLATGNRVYSLNGVTGQQQFRVYSVATVPEPGTIAMISAGAIAGAGVLARKRQSRVRAGT